MQKEKKLQNFMNSCTIAVLVVCVSVLHVYAPTVMAAEEIVQEKVAENTDVAKAAEKKDVKDQPATNTEKETSPAPQTTSTNSGGHTMLYAGIGVAAIAAIAVAAGGGSSGGSSTPEPDPEPTVKPVGADIGGKSWAGNLDLVNGEKEKVTATVVQNGSSVEITTTTTQKYGKKFVGKIDRAGDMLMYDQATGQDWSTHENAARWNRIDIYDYVNRNRELDRLYLTRATKD